MAKRELKMTEREITERKLIARAYKQGRKDFAKDVITALKKEIDNDTDDFGVGYACGLDRATLIIKRLVGGDDDRE